MQRSARTPSSTVGRSAYVGWLALGPILVALAVAITLPGIGLPALGPLDSAEVVDRMTTASTKVYATDGTLIANLHGEIDRDIVSLDEIPAALQAAVVAIEDRRFLDHNGVDLRGVVRAAVKDLKPGSDRIEGGSTITQQLVKNLHFPGAPRTVGRKVVEARLAAWLERVRTKAEILELYLNTVYFGRGVYGVQAASRSYFRKDVSDITLAEAATLAGMIHEPGRYEWSPDDQTTTIERRRAALRTRRDTVLSAMRSEGYADDREVAAARSARIRFHPPREATWQHPYFVDAVLRELGVLRTGSGGALDPRFDFLGQDHGERGSMVYSRGLRIHTTLDPVAQREAEQAVDLQLPPDQRLSAAVVAVEPGTGAVRALVGGRDYYPTRCERDPSSSRCRLAKVNLALGPLGGGSGRQPGSSFKPFVLAAALEDGVSLRESFDAEPFTHSYLGGRWEIDNYEGSGGGRIDLIDATVRSVNAAYARLEIEALGAGDGVAGAAKVADVARRLGISFPTPDELRDRCGDAFNGDGRCTPAESVPSIALGAKEVAPIELAAAYAAFAAEGVHAAPTTIAKITTADGEVLYEARPRTRRAISRDAALGVTHALEQVVRRGTGTRAAIGRPVAGKTGTSQAWRDAWFAGFTPHLASVVWVGNAIPAPGPGGTVAVESMVPSRGYPIRVTGGSYPAAIFASFMAPTLADEPPTDFADPPRSLFAPPEHEPEDEDEEEDDVFPGVIPDVVGMSKAAAMGALRRAGYDVDSTLACPSGGAPEGITVWKQSPSGGEALEPGSTVSVWASRAVCR